VFWFNCRSPKLGSLVPREEDYPARLFCVAFKHWAFFVKPLNIITGDHHAGRNFSPALARIITHEVKGQK
jgi:hypothetical protein